MHRSLRPLFIAFLVAGCASSSSKSDDPSEAPGGQESALETSSAPSLVVPLIDEKKKLLSRFNAAARAKGLQETPDTVEVKNQADGQKVFELRNYFADNVQEAVHAPDQPMPSWGPDSFTNWSKRNHTPGLCYKGNPKKVVELMASLADSVFSDQLMVHGWRYKSEKHFADGDEEFENDFPDVWGEWRGTGTSILVISSIGDGGDDLSPAIIPRCK